MRILIFSESDEAKQLAEKLREDDHRASLRNPQYFSDAPSQYEPCEKVYATDPTILAVYESKGVETCDTFNISSRKSAQVEMPVEPAIEPATEAEPAPKPKRRTRKKASK